MRRLFTFILISVFCAFFVNAQEWNMSNDEFNSLGVLSETAVINGLTIYANSEKTVEIDSNNKSLDGMEFSHRLKLGGSGDFDDEGQPLGRVLSVEVTGDAKITVIGMSSSSSADRELHLAAENKNSVFATFPALGTPISKGEYNYTGGPTTIYLYSPSSGVNIYYLKVEEDLNGEDIAEGEWNISDPQFNALGSFTETLVVDGLTMYAAEGKNLEVDGNNKTLEDWTFTHRLKFGGAGGFDEDGKPLNRVVAFDVPGNSKITIALQSSSGSEDRVLNVAVDHKDEIIAQVPALGASISKGEVEYMGGPASIYLYSPSSGVNIYLIKVEPLTVSTPIINIPEEVRVFPNPANDRVFVNVKQPTQVAIYNLAGSMVKSRLIESQNDFINVSDLQPGMYLIKSQFTNEFTQKLIVR